ncbi:reverse transcriptase domain-containing protein [Tanacetum coccineum]
MEVFTTKQKGDLLMNIHALKKLDAMLIVIPQFSDLVSTNKPDKVSTYNDMDVSRAEEAVCKITCIPVMQCMRVSHAEQDRQHANMVEYLAMPISDMYMCISSADNAPNMFSIRIHHDGRFRRYPGRMYVNDHVDIFDMVDIDIFTVVALNMMVIKLGYTGESEPLFYNYLRPLTSLDEGLYALACKEDVRCMDTLVWSLKLIEVYIEHGVTALDSYLRAPRFRAKLEEIIDEPRSIAAKRTEKILLLTWHESSEITKEPVCDSVTLITSNN